jgi:trigger factor
MIKANPFDLPKAMIRNQQALLAERAIANLRQSYQGISDDALKNILEQWRPDLEKDAERIVRSYLIIEQVAKDRSVEVSDKDLEEKFHELAREVSQTADQIGDYYRRRNPKALENLKAQIKEDKVIDLLVAGCKVIDS